MARRGSGIKGKLPPNPGHSSLEPTLREDYLADMLQSFRAQFQRLAGDLHGPLILACSGGSDSMALAELTAEAAKLEGRNVIVVHLDHGLREHSGEAEHLAAWAARRGLPLICERLPLPGSLEEDPGNLEARARELRYRALERIAKEKGARAILTGHTADDQAETLWLWLLRGTGLRGLRGIAPKRPVREGSEVRLVRPLLEFTRDQLREYLKTKGTSWLEDPSNADTSLRRNRIRHDLLPYLRETFDIDPVPGAARLGTQARDLSDFLDAQVRERRIGPETLDRFLRLERKALTSGPAALARWSISGTLAAFGVASDLNVARVLQLCEGAATGKLIELGEGIVAQFTSRHIYIGPEQLPLPLAEEIPLHRFEEGGRKLPDWGDLKIGAWTLRIREMSHDVEAPEDPHSARLDRDGLIEPLRLVNPKPGMRIRPMGAEGGKSLSQLLIDRKVPRHWRKNLVVLVDGRGELLWVAGVARGEGAPVSGKTKSCLTLDLERPSA